jgi:glutaminyl-tRNA synthetase
MPPKFDPNDRAITELISLFKSSGISEVKTLEAVRNPKTSAALKQLVLDNKFNDKPLDDKSAGLLASLASQGSKLSDDERNYIARAIVEVRLKTTDQLSGAIAEVRLKTTDQLSGESS